MIPYLPNKPNFTPRELAYMLHVSTNTVYEWITSGILAADGRPVQIRRAEIERFFESGEAATYLQAYVFE